MDGGMAGLELLKVGDQRSSSGSIRRTIDENSQSSKGNMVIYTLDR